MAAEYWCKKLVGKRARYAGSPDMSSRTRVAAIIVPNQQTNVVNANELRRLVTGGQCGAGQSAYVYTYELNPATAAEQARALIQKMRTDRVTSILVFSEPIGPAFFTKGATAQGFFPEYVMVGVNFTDYDLVGRLYDQAQWVNAFGVSHISARVAKERQEATVAYHRGGGTGLPHGQAELDYFYMGLIATGVQMAGPNLTPLTFERGLLTMPPRGGWAQTRGRADLFLVQFGPDDYTALSDAREVYWSNSAVSTVDGRPGAYVAFNNGRRYRLGEWPAGEPSLPGR
jgi:hypothetical protein